MLVGDCFIYFILITFHTAGQFFCIIPSYIADHIKTKIADGKQGSCAFRLHENISETKQLNLWSI